MAEAPLQHARVRGYCIVDRNVGTMRWMCIFSRSRQSGTRGAILVFQWSVSYTASVSYTHLTLPTIYSV